MYKSPFLESSKLMPFNTSFKFSTCAKVFAEKITSACPYFFKIFLLSFDEKKSLMTLILFFLASSHAFLEGSTPI